jgi:hypothetical protein
MRAWRVGCSLAPYRHIADFGIGMFCTDGIFTG